MYVGTFAEQWTSLYTLGSSSITVYGWRDLLISRVWQAWEAREDLEGQRLLSENNGTWGEGITQLATNSISDQLN